MKAVDIQDDLPALLKDKSIMFIRSQLLGVRYLGQLLATLDSDSSMRSIGGGSATLPIEIWKVILEFAAMETPVNHKFVQAVSLRKLSVGIILHCREITLLDVPWCGEFEDPEDILAFEEFMHKPDQKDSLPFQAPTVVLKEDMFDVLVISRDKYLSEYSTCLFSNINVPDFIAHRQGGYCDFCQNLRSICPGCIIQRVAAFDLSTGCGIELPCPVCIGVRIAQDFDTWYNTDEYWVRGESTEEAREAERLLDIRQRGILKWLDY